MKIYFILIPIIFFSSCSIAQKQSKNDIIVGTFFSNLYSCHEINEDLSLVKEIPKEFYSGEMPYKEEYDVSWQLDFQKNGEIKMKQLFYGYCGAIVILESGKWQKAGTDSYIITLKGYCYTDFISEKKYQIIDSEDGFRKLKIKE